MQIRSLAYRTDLIFFRFDAMVVDRGGYVVIRTPSNPTYYWGNFLLFREPPTDGSLSLWKQRFQEEIASKQPARHMVFGWDSPEGETGEVGPFLADGFLLSENIVLTAEAVNPPPRPNAEVVIRPLATAADWEQATQNQIACRSPEFSLRDYLPYKRGQMESYRLMAAEGTGAWLGAFAGDRLVADLGVFVEGDVARFQAVETHPEFRRQGICGTLVYESSRYALDALGANRLVMVAEEHYHAARIYESVGFRPTERQVGLEKRPNG